MIGLYISLRKHSSQNSFFWILRLYFNVPRSESSAHAATPLSWLALVTDRQITAPIHPFIHYGITFQMKSPSITAVNATCKRYIDIGQKPVFRSNRSFFPVTLSPLSLCGLETIRYVQLWPLLPEEMLASGQGGRRGNLRAPAPITSPAHPLYPPELWWATEGCCHSNGLGLLMPLGLTSWQNSLSSSPRKRSGPLCWTAVYVCTRVGAGMLG